MVTGEPTPMTKVNLALGGGGSRGFVRVGGLQGLLNNATSHRTSASFVTSTGHPWLAEEGCTQECKAGRLAEAEPVVGSTEQNCHHRRPSVRSDAEGCQRRYW